MQDVLHYLPLMQRIEFMVAVLHWHSLIGQVLAYLFQLCRSSLRARSTRHLRSAEMLLTVPLYVPGFRVINPLKATVLYLGLREILIEWASLGSRAVSQCL